MLKQSEYKMKENV